MQIVKPTGKITAIEASTITAAYGSATSGAQKLRSLEKNLANSAETQAVNTTIIF